MFMHMLPILRSLVLYSCKTYFARFETLRIVTELNNAGRKNRTKKV